MFRAIDSQASSRSNLTPELLKLFRENDRLCPHFHMSIQSANTRVLAGMKRKYTADDVEWALNAIAETTPGAFVGMDVIVGFPGETEEEFADTYARLERTPLDAHSRVPI